MTTPSTGPVAAEITARLTKALTPTRLEVINDSAGHRGHAGDDGSGESHFTVIADSPVFEGQSRVARQRLVNTALGALMAQRIHALAIRAHAPGAARLPTHYGLFRRFPGGAISSAWPRRPSMSPIWVLLAPARTRRQ